MLDVDCDLYEVPHICSWNDALIETKFYAHLSGNQTHPMLLSDKGVRYVPKNPDQSPHRPRTSHSLPATLTLPYWRFSFSYDICFSKTKIRGRKYSQYILDQNREAMLQIGLSIQ
jgi:hypothetical protein